MQKQAKAWKSANIYAKKSLQKVWKTMLKHEHLSKVCKKCENFGKSMLK